MAGADPADLPDDPFGWVGETLADGTYVVERVEAHGGFAVVYRARHQRLGRPVAVKCLLPKHMGTGRTWREDFLKEANLLQELSTGNSAIVQAYDARVERSPRGGESVFVILEWLEGRTLESDIGERGGAPTSGSGRPSWTCRAGAGRGAREEHRAPRPEALEPVRGR